MAGTTMYGIALVLHVLGAVVWVGGMFFAYVVMRPTVVELLEGPERLRFFERSFARFFVWVWIAVAVVPSGITTSICLDPSAAGTT